MNSEVSCDTEDWSNDDFFQKHIATPLTFDGIEYFLWNNNERVCQTTVIRIKAFSSISFF